MLPYNFPGSTKRPRGSTTLAPALERNVSGYSGAKSPVRFEGHSYLLVSRTDQILGPQLARLLPSEEGMFALLTLKPFKRVFDSVPSS